MRPSIIAKRIWAESPRNLVDWSPRLGDKPSTGDLRQSAPTILAATIKTIRKLTPMAIFLMSKYEVSELSQNHIEE